MLGGFGRGWSVLGVVAALLEGRLGFNSCKALRLVADLPRQGI